MQIPILNGIFSDESSDFRTSYPRNLTPVPKKTGVSNGYLRPSDGIVEFGEGPGIDKGGINWDDECYRVMGTKLIKIINTGAHVVLGDVGTTDQVTLDYSFDYLGINAGDRLYLWDKTTLQQVTDTDLGPVVDMVWVDGYFMFTDGEFIGVTDINNPFSVNPIKYASSEADPDPIKGLLKIRNEAYAMNRYTTEVFDNKGGSGFPFARVEGAQIEKGILGTNSACVFMEKIAFVGGGRNESPSVYLGLNGQAVQIATREVDQILLDYTEEQLANILCEARVGKGSEHLWIHLPDQVLVYDAKGSQLLGEPVWHTLTSSLIGKGIYRGQNLVWCYDKWLVGDPVTSKHGELVSNISSHYGQEIGWDFSTLVLYSEGKGVLFHEIELECLTGRVELGVNPTIWTQYSIDDGRTWSQEFAISAGKQGERNERIIWFQQGYMRKRRVQRFRGTSESHVSIARLQAEIEKLNA